MRKHFAMMLVLAMLVLVLAGCMKTKVFEVNKNPSQSVVPQESSSEDATKPADSSEPAAEESSEAPAAQTEYDWGEVKVTVTDVTEDVGMWSSTLSPASGKWVMVVLTISYGKMETGKLSDMILVDNLVTLKGVESGTLSQQGIEIVDDQAYAVGNINLFYDMPTDYVPNIADVEVKTPDPNKMAEAQTEEPPAEEMGTVDGLSVVGAEIYKPATGEMAYRPSGASGYFAVNGTLKANSVIGIAVDPPGTLNCDITLEVGKTMTVEAKIEVYKDGSMLASYSESGLELPEGSTVINACVQTEESMTCSGTYMIRFYINGTFIYETEGDV